jgi:peptidoglycan/xylan/chitin deacetylase (PgdA/CDA1 family)
MNMFRIVSDQEFEEVAKPALISLCGTDNPDPYGDPFSAQVTCRRILFQYDHMPENQFTPYLADALR